MRPGATVVFGVALLAMGGCVASPPPASLAAIPDDPAEACVRAIPAEPQFSLIRNKVRLGFYDEREAAVSPPATSATPAEATQISAWRDAHWRCYEVGESWRRVYLTAAQQRIYAEEEVAADQLAQDLAAGRITFSQFDAQLGAREPAFFAKMEAASPAPQPPPSTQTAYISPVIIYPWGGGRGGCGSRGGPGYRRANGQCASWRD